MPIIDWLLRLRHAQVCLGRGGTARFAGGTLDSGATRSGQRVIADDLQAASWRGRRAGGRPPAAGGPCARGLAQRADRRARRLHRADRPVQKLTTGPWEALKADLAAGAVDALIVIDANPAYDSADDSRHSSARRAFRPTWASGRTKRPRHASGTCRCRIRSRVVGPARAGWHRLDHAASHLAAVRQPHAPRAARHLDGRRGVAWPRSRARDLAGACRRRLRHLVARCPGERCHRRYGRGESVGRGRPSARTAGRTAAGARVGGQSGSVGLGRTVRQQRLAAGVPQAVDQGGLGKCHRTFGVAGGRAGLAMATLFGCRSMASSSTARCG